MSRLFLFPDADEVRHQFPVIGNDGDMAIVFTPRFKFLFEGDRPEKHSIIQPRFSVQDDDFPTFIYEFGTKLHEKTQVFDYNNKEWLFNFFNRFNEICVYETSLRALSESVVYKFIYSIIPDFYDTLPITIFINRSDSGYYFSNRICLDETRILKSRSIKQSYIHDVLNYNFLLFSSEFMDKKFLFFDVLMMKAMQYIDTRFGQFSHCPYHCFESVLEGAGMAPNGRSHKAIGRLLQLNYIEIYENDTSSYKNCIRLTQHYKDDWAYLSKHLKNLNEFELLFVTLDRESVDLSLAELMDRVHSFWDKHLIPLISVSASRNCI